MLKTAELIELSLTALQECLSSVPFVRVDLSRRKPGSSKLDFQIRLQGKDFEQEILVEIKSPGTPKRVREAVNSLLVALKKLPSAYGIVMAPYISPVSAGICKQAGVGYVDLSGNCYLAFQQVFISRENLPNRYPFKTGLVSLYAPKSERILRVLLSDVIRYWKTVELAEAAGVSLGMISQVSKKLREEEWLLKTAEGIRLSQPEALLLDWVSHYSLDKSKSLNYYTLQPLPEIERQIAELCAQRNIRYALTGFSAANRLSPVVKGQRAMIYIENKVDAIAADLGLKWVESGANITLIQPYDAGIFWDSSLIDELIIASPIQVYLDLKGYPGRGEEAADFLFQEVIKPSWQISAVNMT